MGLPWSRRVRRWLGAAAALVLVGGAVALATGAADADDDDAPVAAQPAAVSAAAGSHREAAGATHACGIRSAATVADVDQQVAKRIYGEELSGRETRADEAHVRQSGALLSALSSGNAAAIHAAVAAIVYTPHWHIVRLRVLRGSRVLADVGGPYVIAPVTGTLELHGRTLGTYVMSVQDDTGYVKLVSRLIDVPIELYRGRSVLMGTLQPPPSLPRSETPVAVGRGTYLARVFAAGSFPAGTLNVALLVPRPGPASTALSCGQLLANAWGSVAMHVAARLALHATTYDELVRVVRATSGASVFVLSGGHSIAGGAPPRHLPQEGSVRVGGQTRWVFSWPAAPQVRVYVVAPSPPS